MFKRVRFTTAASPKAKRSRGEMEVLHSLHLKGEKMPDASLLDLLDLLVAVQH